MATAVASGIEGDVSKYTHGLIGLGVTSLVLLVVSMGFAALTAVLYVERCHRKYRQYSEDAYVD